MLKILSILIFLFSSIASAETLKKIDIIGNDRIPKNTILMFSNVSIGDQVKNIDTNNILKNLYDTNFFRNVVVNLNENILEINVLEFPIVQNVSVH